jgi:hypothetical protein
MHSFLSDAEESIGSNADASADAGADASVDASAGSDLIWWEDTTEGSASAFSRVKADEMRIWNGSGK